MSCTTRESPPCSFSSSSACVLPVSLNLHLVKLGSVYARASFCVVDILPSPLPQISMIIIDKTAFWIMCLLVVSPMFLVKICPKPRLIDAHASRAVSVLFNTWRTRRIRRLSVALMSSWSTSVVPSGDSMPSARLMMLMIARVST